MGKKIAQTLGRVLPSLSRDIIGVAGTASISYGAWLVYQPAGFIVGGIIVVGAVLLLSAKSE